MKAKITLENGKEFEVTLSVEDVQQLETKKEEWPTDGDRYYYADNNNTIGYVPWCYDEVDEYNKLTNNCFRTKEEAEKHLNRIRNKWAIAKRIKELNSKANLVHDSRVQFCFNGREIVKESTHWDRSPKELQMNGLDIAAKILAEFGEETIKDVWFNLS